MKAKLLDNFLFKKIKNWAKANTLPGFQEVPIYDVAYFIYKEIQEEGIINRSKSIAFSFFLSLFPALLSFFTLIPLVLPFFESSILNWIPQDEIIKMNGQVDLNQTILWQIESILSTLHFFPETGVAYLMQIANDFLFNSRFGLLSIGFVLAIFFSSNGIVTIMNGFEKTAHDDTFVKRNGIKKRLISLQMLLVFAFVFAVALLLVIFGNPFLTYLTTKLNIQGFAGYILFVLRWVFVFFLFYAGFAIIYRLGISIKEKVKFFSIGATVATILSLLSSLIFAYYVDSFGNYNELYGSIGTIIVVLLWLQINAFIIIVGFELNASIAVNKEKKKIISKKND